MNGKRHRHTRPLKFKSDYEIAKTKLYKRGFTLPGHNYTGPLNRDYTKKANNPTDAASRVHDKRYTKYEKEGKNPYTHFNRADAIWLHKTRDQHDAGAYLGHAWFKAKRMLRPSLDETSSPLMSQSGSTSTSKKRLAKFDAQIRHPKSQRIESIPGNHDYFKISDFKEPEMNAQKKSLNYMSDFKKTKLYLTKLNGVGKKNFGKTLPMQTHTVNTAHKMAVSLTNKRAWKGFDLLTPSMISIQMFNPRYFQETVKNAGTLGVAGPTMSWFNSVSASNNPKSIFGANTLDDNGVIATYRLNNVATNAALAIPATAAGADAISGIYHTYAHVYHSHMIQLKNNYNNPVVCTIFEVTPKQDYSAFTPASPLNALEIFNDINALWRFSIPLSYSTRPWYLGTDGVVSDDSVPSACMDELYFSPTGLHKDSLFFKYFKITSKRVVMLPSGKLTKFSLPQTHVKFDVASTVSRLIDIGYDTLGALPEPTGASTSIYSKRLKGIDKYLLISVHGTLSHGTESDAIGTNPAAVDIDIKSRFSWTCKADGWKQLPTKTVNYTGSNTVNLQSGFNEEPVS